VLPIMPPWTIWRVSRPYWWPASASGCTFCAAAHGWAGARRNSSRILAPNIRTHHHVPRGVCCCVLVHLLHRGFALSWSVLRNRGDTQIPTRRTRAPPWWVHAIFEHPGAILAISRHGLGTPLSDARGTSTAGHSRPTAHG
jgi:hypothetical protein